MPTIKNYEPTERAAQIIELAKQALGGAEEVRQRIRLSTEAAIKCGELLIKEKAHVIKTLGRGTWDSYYEITFSKSLPERTARHWMKQANDAANATVSAAIAGNAENTLRASILTLELFPPRRATPSSTAGDVTIVSPKLSSQVATLIGIVNRFAAWESVLKEQGGANLNDEQAQQLLSELAPIARFIDRLRHQVPASLGA